MGLRLVKLHMDEVVDGSSCGWMRLRPAVRIEFGGGALQGEAAETSGEQTVNFPRLDRPPASGRATFLVDFSAVSVGVYLFKRPSREGHAARVPSMSFPECV